MRKRRILGCWQEARKGASENGMAPYTPYGSPWLVTSDFPISEMALMPAVPVRRRHERRRKAACRYHAARPGYSISEGAMRDAQTVLQLARRHVADA